MKFVDLTGFVPISPQNCTHLHQYDSSCAAVFGHSAVCRMSSIRWTIWSSSSGSFGRIAWSDLSSLSCVTKSPIQKLCTFGILFWRLLVSAPTVGIPNSDNCTCVGLSPLTTGRLVIDPLCVGEKHSGAIGSFISSATIGLVASACGVTCLGNLIGRCFVSIATHSLGELHIGLPGHPRACSTGLRHSPLLFHTCCSPRCFAAIAGDCLSSGVSLVSSLAGDIG